MGSPHVCDTRGSGRLTRSSPELPASLVTPRPSLPFHAAKRPRKRSCLTAEPDESYTLCPPATLAAPVSDGGTRCSPP
eukprot:CAMPEP_0202770292 /NCGR_PEP_ID=MMETSP1388-20130828/38534_1 /ASSEMBLY_ACC=CAM_ASM_000864 /TAXON_ID=37098 /ORGANISM="Isochrysis sp, Strain CCMP1244" /LENGTH=77 /DNA_ID=CAMNT_0049439121 /DNA_START=174 /DNA_END=403 /DNA_ORIENTATION=+